jgi:CRP/FNR family transcriptional regulator
VPARAALYKSEDPARSIYYIHQGQVRTYQLSPTGSRRLIEILGTDHWCGTAALGQFECYGETAEAVVPTTVSIISVERLFAVLAQSSGTAIALIRQLAGKLAAYREDASDLVFEDCNHRLIRTLVQLSDSPAASASADGVILRITHQQLAQKVGVARETVSLALAQLRRRNLLRTGRNQLFFSPDRLKNCNSDEPAAPSGKAPGNGKQAVQA